MSRRERSLVRLRPENPTPGSSVNVHIYIYTIHRNCSLPIHPIHLVSVIQPLIACRLSFAYCSTPMSSPTSLPVDSDHRFLNNSLMNPKNAFAYFVQRAQARSLVRYAFRTAYQVRDVNTRKELITWARQEFERNRNVEDPVCGQEVKSFTLQSLT